MLLDWFTIVAQIFNFLLLLWLLRRFLYRPILEAMDKREQLITLRQKEAERSQSEAQQTVDEYRQLASELESKRQQMLSQAHSEAEEQRKEMLKQARQEVEHAQDSWYKAVRMQRETLLHELNQRTSQQTLSIARRVLADLADVELEQQIVRVFLQRIEHLDPEHHDRVSQAVEKSGQALIRTAFDLPPDLKYEIEQTLSKTLPVNGSLSFETENNLICGIELKSGGQKISWSLASYLESIQESISEALRDHQEADVAGSNTIE